MKRISSLIAFALMFGAMGTSTACVSLRRSTGSGYASDDARAGDLGGGRGRLLADRGIALDELGYDDGQPLSRQQNDTVALRTQLNRAEKALQGRREREQYFKNKPYMRSDLERLEFLRLETQEERSRWLTARGILGSATKHPPEIQDLIDTNDITLGMTRQAVRDAWGPPEEIEAAGNPLFGNERWSYSEQIASQEGFLTERRTVFFEAGCVVGWETK